MEQIYTARFKNGRQYKIKKENVRKVKQVLDIIRSDICEEDEDPQETIHITIEEILGYVKEAINITQEELFGVDFTSD